MIKTIELQDALPRVFDGLQQEQRLRESQVWLRPSVLFEKTQSYLVFAESGTGKSSLCAFIYGLRRDYLGKILIDGVDIRNFTIKQWCDIRCRAIAYLPQEMRLFPELTAMENIRIKNSLTDYRSESEIMEMLDRLEIKEQADRRAGLLSLGQQQRVAIVRALCQPYDFLLLDEPVSHLDQRNNGIVARMIVDDARSRDASIIATSVGNHLALQPDFILHL